MGGVFRSQRHKTLFDGELTILEIFKPFLLIKIVSDRVITTSSYILQSIIGCQCSASPTHYSLSLLTATPAENAPELNLRQAGWPVFPFWAAARAPLRPGRHLFRRDDINHRFDVIASSLDDAAYVQHVPSGNTFLSRISAHWARRVPAPPRALVPGSGNGTGGSARPWSRRRRRTSRSLQRSQ